MALAQALRAMSLFVDGNRFVNEVTEVTPPKMALITEDYRGGGMDTAIEIETGLEKLEASFKVSRYDINALRHFGLAPSQQVSISVRGAYSDDGRVVPVVFNMTGTWKEVDLGTMKTGEMPEINVMMALKRYTMEVDGQEVYHVDAEALSRRINGTETLSEIARIIG